MKENDLGFWSAHEMAVAVRKKKVSPVEIVDAILTRIEQVNPKVNAYCTVVPDRARQSRVHSGARTLLPEASSHPKSTSGWDAAVRYRSRRRRVFPLRTRARR